MARDQAYFLNRVLDGAASLGQIVRYHDWMNFNAGIEREKPRLVDGRDLRGILHVEKMNPARWPLSSVKWPSPSFNPDRVDFSHQLL